METRKSDNCLRQKQRSAGTDSIVSRRMTRHSFVLRVGCSGEYSVVVCHGTTVIVEKYRR